MRSLVQNRAVANTTVQLVLSNMGFIVPIVRTGGKIVERVVDKYRPHNMEGASTSDADREWSIERLSHLLRRPAKVPSDFE